MSREKKPKEEKIYTLQDLINCYSAGVLRGIAEANGTGDNVMSPQKYFQINFSIDIFAERPTQHPHLLKQ